MDRMENWLFPRTSIRTVLKMRPLAIPIFEKYGLDPWDLRDIGLEKLCAAKGVSLETFLAEIKSLPVPDSETEWKSKPVFHLLDFLTSEHRHFILVLLPAIKQALAQEPAGNSESLRRLRYLVEEWPSFSAALEGHIHEEETFLFPKILHYEYCLRHKLNHADFSSGSVNVYVALQMLGNEKKQMAAVRRFLNDVMFSSASPQAPGSLEIRLEPLLEELQSRLLSHARLETNMLFPMAKSMEKSLMDARISGGADGMKHPSLQIS